MARCDHLSGSAVAIRANERSPRVNVPFCVAIVLLCLTLVSMHLTGGLFARYTATTSASDSARVANMSTVSFVVVKGSDVQLSETTELLVQPGKSMEVNIVVRNYGTSEDASSTEDVCEVALKCSVSARNITGNLPFTLSLAKKGQEDAQTATGTNPVSIGEDQILFEAGVASTQEYTLSIVWPEGENTADLAFEIDALEITVNTEQVD